MRPLFLQGVVHSGTFVTHYSFGVFLVARRVAGVVTMFFVPKVQPYASPG